MLTRCPIKDARNLTGNATPNSVGLRESSAQLNARRTSGRINEAVSRNDSSNTRVPSSFPSYLLSAEQNLIESCFLVAESVHPGPRERSRGYQRPTMIGIERASLSFSQSRAADVRLATQRGLPRGWSTQQGSRGRSSAGEVSFPYWDLPSSM